MAAGYVVAGWRMGNAAQLDIAVNLSSDRVILPDLQGRVLAVIAADPAAAVHDGTLAAATTAVFLSDGDHLEPRTEAGAIQ